MNSRISQYIKQNIKYPLLIEDIPADDLNMIIVIPCRNDSNITNAVRSIYKASSPECNIEITVVIFADRDDDIEIHSQNLLSDKELHALDDLPTWCRLYVIMNNNFSGAKATSKFASKIGMDDAVRRFAYMEKEDGLIVLHDSSTIVKENYFSSINGDLHNENSNCKQVSKYCISQLQLD